MGLDFYNLLNLPYDATPDEIRAAYFEAARRLHPDINPNIDDNQLFVQIQEAYEILSNPQKRADYNSYLSDEAKSSAEVTYSVTFSRSSVTKLSEPQLIYALVDIHCHSLMNLSVFPPVHICLVIDRSTSMRGDRFEMLRANVRRLLSKLRKNDTISVIGFSDRAEVLVPPTKAFEVIKIESLINQMQIGGATEIFYGLDLAYQTIRRQAGNSANHIFLITDGHTYGDEQACYELAGKAREEGINISAFGIGDEWNDEFLDKLASLGGSNANYVSTADDLYLFFEQKLSSINTSYARNVSIDFECDDTVELQYAFQIHPELTPLSTNSPINLSNLEFGNKISFILEFIVQPIPEYIQEVKFAQGRITMEIPSSPIHTFRIFLNMKRSVDVELKSEKVVPEIYQAMSKLTLYRLQEKARKEVASGNYHIAGKYLQYLATHLIAHGDRKLAQTVLNEAEHIRGSHQFSKEGDKRIKYGTRSLLLLPAPEQ